MELICCPVCNVDVPVNDFEDDAGICPECGAVMTGSTLFGDTPDGDEYDLDDDFDDLDDDETEDDDEDLEIDLDDDDFDDFDDDDEDDDLD